MLLIAQLSDPHVTDDLGIVPVDPRARLRSVLDNVNGRAAPVDLVLITGDLTEDGTPEQYTMLAELLEDSPTRVMVLPGNHDRGEALRETLANYLPASLEPDHLGYVIDDFDLRIVCLDTTHPKRHDGVLSEASQTWLDSTLGENNKPTMVFMHHAAIASGIIWMDAQALSNPDDFRNIIARHPHVVAVSSGHMHRSYSGRIAHAAATVAPSTSHQLNLNFAPDTAGLVVEPPAYLLHHWHDDALVSHTVQVGNYEVLHANDWAAQSRELSAKGEGFPKS